MTHADEFFIPEGKESKACLSCGAEIYWAVTRKGKATPVNPDGVSHFETCPHADDWRGATRRGNPQEDTALYEVDINISVEIRARSWLDLERSITELKRAILRAHDKPGEITVLDDAVIDIREIPEAAYDAR